MKRRELVDKVFRFTREKALFSAPCHVLIGLSGGADSMTLLDIMTHWPEAGVRVSAIHVHHGLRGDAADRDAAFVRRYCEQHNVPLTVVCEDVASVSRDRHCSLEEAGRMVRYEQFEAVRVAVGADYVLTAHTASDQVETVLMHVLRGCGVDGLAGMPCSREAIRRPLLCCDREEIELYCAENDISYVMDESNGDTQFTRNDIRHRVLPVLREINPAVDQAILRLSKHSSEESAYLNGLAVTSLKDAQSDNGYLAENFSLQDPVIRRRMIRLLLNRSGIATIEESHILLAEKVIIKGHGLVYLPDRRAFSVQQGVVSIRELHQTATELVPVRLDCLPYTCMVCGKEYEVSVTSVNVHKLFLNGAVDYDRIQGDLWLRSRQPGDYFHAAGRGVGKSLKKWMNEWHIPSHLRDSYPVLCDDKGVVLVPGYACDERVRITDDTKHFLVCKTMTEQG